jgi:hypothetical protein
MILNNDEHNPWRYISDVERGMANLAPCYYVHKETIRKTET